MEETALADSVMACAEPPAGVCVSSDVHVHIHVHIHVYC